jgi:prevent-host-death family protein
MTIWSFSEALVKNVTVVEAKSRFSALLAEVEAGEEIAVTRHGKVVARLVPDRPRMAVDAFRDFWTDEGINLVAPEDMPAEDVTSLDE